MDNIEKVGLSEAEVKSIVDGVTAPFVAEMKAIRESKEVAAKAPTANELAGMCFKKLAGKKLSAAEQKAITTYANETTAADGGNVVPKEYASEILRLAVTDDQILSRLRSWTISLGNSIQIPCDETAPWRAAGVTAYWGTEGVAKTQSKPVFKIITLTLEKLYTFVPATDELLEDNNVNVASYIADKAAMNIKGALLKAVLYTGSTANQVKSMKNSGCTLTVARTVANTVSFTDIARMYGAMWPESVSSERAVWIANPKIMSHILTMEDTSGHLVFMPQGISGKPYPTLLGMPFIATGHLPTVGTECDLMLVDPSQYILASRDPKSDESIHFAFDQDMTVFRVVARYAGQIWLSDDYKTQSNDQYSFVVILGDTTSTGTNALP